jgi:regulator of cell morphogenesis and NO signaling
MKSVSHYFERDHDRLHDLFHAFQLMKAKDFPRARENFVAFKFGLQRHMVWEEEVLFPFYEQKTGLYPAGPTNIMRKEHRKIREILESIDQKLRAFDANTKEEESTLFALLEIHSLKEENILYPVMDNYLTEIEEKSILEAIKNIPDERYTLHYQDR